MFLTKEELDFIAKSTHLTPIVDTFYKIVGENRIGTYRFEKYILERDYAYSIFQDLRYCADIEYCYIMDATTGEIIKEFRR